MKPWTTPALVGAALVSAAAGFALEGSTAGAALIGGLVAGALVCLAVVLRDARLGILVSAIGALGASGYLLSRKLESASGTSICSVNEVLNCDVINASVYSELWGTPISLYGSALYVGIALAAWLARDKSAQLFRTVALLMIPALVYSVFLAYISKTIGALCLFCLSMYVAHLWMLIAGLRGLRAEGEGLFSRLGEALGSRSAVTIGTTFAASVLIGGAVLSGSMRGGSAQPLPVDSTGAVPASALSSLYLDMPASLELLDGTEPVLGDPDAPYLVVEFADFACPHCADATHALEALVADNPQLQVRFKSFPLSGPCDVPPPTGPTPDGFSSDRCRAAIAAECAHQQGKAWPYIHAQFKNLGYLSAADLRFHAEAKGLDLAAYDACMGSAEALASVVADAEAGRRAGVQGTPALFIFGLRDNPVQLMARPDRIEALLDAHRAGRALPRGTASPAH